MNNKSIIFIIYCMTAIGVFSSKAVAWDPPEPEPCTWCCCTNFNACVGCCICDPEGELPSPSGCNCQWGPDMQPPPDYGSCKSWCNPQACKECDGQGHCKECNDDPDKFCCEGSCCNRGEEGCCNGDCYDLNQCLDCNAISGKVESKCKAENCETCDGEGHCVVCGGDPNLICCNGDCYDPDQCLDCNSGKVESTCKAEECEICDGKGHCVVCGGDPNLTCCNGECCDGTCCNGECCGECSDCNEISGHCEPLPCLCCDCIDAEPEHCTIRGSSMYCIGQRLTTGYISSPTNPVVSGDTVTLSVSSASDYDCLRWAVPCFICGVRSYDPIETIWSVVYAENGEPAGWLPDGNTGASVRWNVPVVFSNTDVIITVTSDDHPDFKYDDAPDSYIIVRTVEPNE